MLKSIIVFVSGFIIGYILIKIILHYIENNDGLWVKVTIKKNGEWVTPTEEELMQAIKNQDQINLETKSYQNTKFNNKQ